MAGTDTQHLEKLLSYWKRHHAFSSMATLYEVVGPSSITSAFDLVGRLEEAGYIQRAEARIAPTRGFFAWPSLGAVRAGLSQPCQSGEGFEAIIIDDYFVPDPNRTFLARLKGDSMRDASLLEGNIVVVQKNAPTRLGDIVVAAVDGQVRAKNLRQQPHGRFYLQPANAAFADILPEDEFEVLRVVVGSFRSYRR